MPVVNVFGFINGRYLPDRRDLNRSFPGSPRGSLASRIAHLFMTEIIEHCQYGIDLHCGSDHRTNHPQIRADLDDPRSACRGVRGPGHGARPYRTARSARLRRRRGWRCCCSRAARRAATTTTAVGAGVAARCGSWPSSAWGTRGPAAVTGAVVEHTPSGSGPGQRDRPHRRPPRAPWPPGDCSASSPTPSAPRPRAGPEPGIVIGLNRHPLVGQGDALVHLADLSPEAKGGPAPSPVADARARRPTRRVRFPVERNGPFVRLDHRSALGRRRPHRERWFNLPQGRCPPAGVPPPPEASTAGSHDGRLVERVIQRHGGVHRQRQCRNDERQRRTRRRRTRCRCRSAGAPPAPRPGPAGRRCDGRG